MDNTPIQSDQSIWYIIANQTAGSGKCGKYLPGFLKFLEKSNIEFQIAYTQSAGHANELAFSAAELGFRKFIVAGGDGSLNEVLNGVMKFKYHEDLPFVFASAPLGTANDWSRYYGMSSLEQFCVALKRSKFVNQDIGVINWADESTLPTYFINVLGLGFDSFVADALQKSGKGSMGTLSYLLTLVKCLFKYQSDRFDINSAEYKYLGSLFTVNVGITPYSGNKMMTVPHADPADGLLAITSILPLKPMEVIANLPRLYNGSLGKNDKVTLFQTSEIKVSQPENAAPVLIEADGELVGRTPCTLACLPNKIFALDGR
jgi:YegS/Rv2252/BmrU family lipid kinase